MPSASMPGADSATCNSVAGSGVTATAEAMGACASQARAAGASRTRNSNRQHSV